MTAAAPADAETPYLRPGQPLTAARALRLTAMLRRTPGVEVLLRIGGHQPYPIARARQMLGPGVMVRRDGDRLYVRARITGEPVRPPVRRDTDSTGQWITLAAAARRVGVNAHWFKERYVRSGLVPVHTHGVERHVRVGDVERAAALRAGGAVVAAHDWATVDLGPDDYVPFSQRYSTSDAIRTARRRLEGRA